MHIDGKLTALIRTGTTVDGQPDHSAVADLLARLYTGLTAEHSDTAEHASHSQIVKHPMRVCI
jgi:hypothetical protein